ncbi:MAG: helix-turn-helix transcriptional regulator, partial [Ktedonobacteraceae bacterium]|nr:helix-turn-helix transcriptional regulator [Ktedonobacteraceae bacterium]
MEREKLRIARSERGWTQEEAAEHFQVTRETISHWERGTKNPYPVHIRQICQTYGKTPIELDLMPMQHEILSRFPSEEHIRIPGDAQAYMNADLNSRLLALTLHASDTWQLHQSLEDTIERFARNANEASLKATLSSMVWLPLVMDAHDKQAVTQRLNYYAAGICAC